jgi:aerobic-type carbon monoxide dehydrogenase small subunit (CoxS/CutS family)
VANGSDCQSKHANGDCKGNGGCKAKQAAAAGVTRVTSAQLLGALDGNLCRCTGWRPIADCAKVRGTPHASWCL